MMPVMESVLGDSWYADELGVTTLESVIRERRHWSRALSSRAARGVALWWFGRRYQLIVTSLGADSTRTLLLCEGLFPRRGRHLVLLEFIPVVGDARNKWAARARGRLLLSSLYWRWLVGPTLRRSLLCAQSLTQWEVERNAAAFRLPLDRFRHIPWFSSFDQTGESDGPARPRSGVLVSGRAACDWDTVFAAAEGQDWPLTVVCSRPDFARVSALNRGGRARVLCEISKQEHAALMREASVYLLALHEAEVSSGQVRLLDATVAGTPLVASAVRGLLEYVTDGETALLFPPGDARAAQAALNRAYGDPSLRHSLVAAADKRGRQWSRQEYLEAVRQLVAYAHKSVAAPARH